jgi:hypothetical protein
MMSFRAAYVFFQTRIFYRGCAFCRLIGPPQLRLPEGFSGDELPHQWLCPTLPLFTKPVAASSYWRARVTAFPSIVLAVPALLTLTISLCQWSSTQPSGFAQLLSEVISSAH